ncbi:MAG: anti-sigma factor RsiW [Akkermansiaceae bacterium]|jgi:anti-sigma factor RsiW
MPEKNSKHYSVMKKEKTEELFVKWIDGQLSRDEDAQLRDLLNDDPDLEGELGELKALRQSVKAEIPASVEPPYGDFFNSQLMRKVDLQIESQRPVKKAERWWQSFRWAWAPVGALALVLSFFAGHRIARPEMPMVAETKINQPEQSALTTVYFTGEALDAEVISDSEGDVSVIVVTGLSAIRDDIDFATVTTSIELPKSFSSSEARRFQ